MSIPGPVPGASASPLTGAIDDTAGSGVVIPLNVIDDQLVDWRMQKLEGWDSPELAERSEERTDADGRWDTVNYYGGRLLTVEGTFTAPTYEAREAAEYRLREAVPRDRLVPFRLHETVPKQCLARRTGRLMIRPLTDVTSEFSVAMLAPDPRKYGVDLVAASMSLSTPGTGLAPPWTPPVLLPERAGGSETATVINAGIYASQPLIKISGPGRVPQVINDATGANLLYDFELGATDFLLVDCLAGVALLNGTAPRTPSAGSTVTSLFVIVPGENRLRFAGETTDPVLVPGADVQFFPAWI